MFRFILPLVFIWIFFDFINVLLLGQLTANDDVSEKTKQNWFIFAVLGGPIFTVIAFLMYFMRSSEKHYTEAEREEKKQREKEAYQDIFEDE